MRIYFMIALFFCFNVMTSLSDSKGQMADVKTPESQVGMSKVLEDVILNGTELEVKPVTDDLAPIVLRIVRVAPHGQAFRYTLEYSGLETGTFHLRDYLQRKDASSVEDLPLLPVTIISRHEKGQLIPADPKVQGTSWFHHYETTLAMGVILWMVVFWYILKMGKKSVINEDVEAKNKTPFEVLQGYMERAKQGELNKQEQAEVERLVYAVWREKLGLVQTDSAEVIAELKKHPEAGQSIRKLERWLHAPQGTSMNFTEIMEELAKANEKVEVSREKELAGV